SRTAEGVRTARKGWRRGWESNPYPSLRCRKLLIFRSDRNTKFAQIAEARYTAGTRTTKQSSWAPAISCAGSRGHHRCGQTGGISALPRLALFLAAERVAARPDGQVGLMPSRSSG